MKFNEYLTVSQASEFIGVTKETLRNWEKDARVKVYRHPLNNWRLYKKDDLQLVLDSIKSNFDSEPE